MKWIQLLNRTFRAIAVVLLLVAAVLVFNALRAVPTSDAPHPAVEIAIDKNAAA